MQSCYNKLLVVLLVAGFTTGPANAEPLQASLPPEVVKAMQKVHQGFQGQDGYVAQFGDSITYSMAFWAPMSWDGPEK